MVLAPAHIVPQKTYVTGHPTRRLGLRTDIAQPRRVSFTHMKETLGITVPEQPRPFDFYTGFPSYSGVLGNDLLGNCAFAGIVKAIMVASWKITGQLLDVAACTVLAIQFYMHCGKYDPTAKLAADGTNPSDDGGDPVAIERWLLQNAFPMPNGEEVKFEFTFEIDNSKLADIAYVGSQCYGFGMGVIITDTVMPPSGDLPDVFVSGGNIEGAHFMWGTGLGTDGDWRAQTWGLNKLLGPSFMGAFNGSDASSGNLMMATGYIHSAMFLNGQTVMGKTLADLRAYNDQYATEVTA